ncbi:MAG TPA: MgtC/SapB family protein, partial [Tepidisphaeraceae bacterium]
NRGEHGRPAGMRTTLLVCLAASISMIQANLLLATAGRHSDSFIMLDLMRLPLGILSGMGFIGAGAILRRDNMVVGITTAATLWFVTVVGLCFGGGQIMLGIVATILGLMILWSLKFVENAMRQDTRATISLSLRDDGPGDQELRDRIGQCDCKIVSWGVRFDHAAQQRDITCIIEWHVRSTQTTPPPFIGDLASDARILKLQWQPQGIQFLSSAKTSNE